MRTALACMIFAISMGSNLSVVDCQSASHRSNIRGVFQVHGDGAPPCSARSSPSRMTRNQQVALGDRPSFRQRH